MLPRIPTDQRGSENLIQGLGFERDVGFAGSFFRRVFFHPGFPAFSSSGVASGEGERCDIGVEDGDFFVRVFGVETDQGILERRRGAAVEEIAFDFGAIFAGDSYVAAVVEGFFEGDADFFVGGELRDPAFEIFVGGAGSDFEGVGICVGHGLRGLMVDMTRFFACHRVLLR
jgi:hypothetical protein